MSELSDRIQNVIDNEPVTLFMKGTPQFVMCGNSQRALEALRRAGAPVTAVDILPDPRIREELSGLSGWPTIPRLFVDKELVGGSDIVIEMFESGGTQQSVQAGDFSFRLGLGPCLVRSGLQICESSVREQIRIVRAELLAA